MYLLVREVDVQVGARGHDVELGRVDVDALRGRARWAAVGHTWAPRRAGRRRARGHRRPAPHALGSSPCLQLHHHPGVRRPPRPPRTSTTRYSWGMVKDLYDSYCPTISSCPAISCGGGGACGVVPRACGRSRARGGEGPGVRRQEAPWSAARRRRPGAASLKPRPPPASGSERAPALLHCARPHLVGGGDDEVGVVHGDQVGGELRRAGERGAE